MKNQTNFAMKKLNLFLRGAVLCAVLAASFLFSSCDVNSMSSLRSFAKPYAGEYVCTYARFGEKDLLEEFREIILTLEDGGNFLAELTPKRGPKLSATGSYEYGGEGNEILFTADLYGKRYSKAAVFENGRFTIEQTYAGKKLVLRFEVKT